MKKLIALGISFGVVAVIGTMLLTSQDWTNTAETIPPDLVSKVLPKHWL